MKQTARPLSPTALVGSILSALSYQAVASLKLFSRRYTFARLVIAFAWSGSSLSPAMIFSLAVARSPFWMAFSAWLK
jgi:hypothetical protein